MKKKTKRTIKIWTVLGMDLIWIFLVPMFFTIPSTFLNILGLIISIILIIINYKTFIK